MVKYPALEQNHLSTIFPQVYQAKFKKSPYFKKYPSGLIQWGVDVLSTYDNIHGRTI